MSALALPDVLAAAPMRPVAYVIDVAGVARLALSPDEVAPLLGLSAKVVRELCRTGQIAARVLHPGSSNARYLVSVGALIAYLGSAVPSG